jgi:indolepyruvate decarboxylase
MAAIWEFLVDRVRTSGVRDGFGVPGYYVLDFYDKLFKSKIRVIGCTSEMNAGYAADAYARVNGIGLVVATYCVGGFSLMNAIACAYAEESPVLFISGAPGVKERKQDLYLRHMVGTFDCQHEVMQKVTCASAVLDNPALAGYEIDRVLDAIKTYKQPGYIELPCDMVNVPLSYDSWSLGTPPDVSGSDEINLNEAVLEAVNWINSAEKPVILAGVEVARHGFGKQLIKFAQAKNIPIATTLLGKSVINERHPLSLGVFCGGLSNVSAEEAINNSDCIIGIGVLMTDIHFGFAPTRFLRRNMILSTCQDMQIRNHSYKKVSFTDFFKSLIKSDIKEREQPRPRYISNAPFVAERGKKLSTSRLFEKIRSTVKDNMAVIADVGDSLFGAADLDVNCNHFLSPAFYTTMGFSIPGALGVQIADKNIRPVVIVGDGAFQMNSAELSTIGRLGLNPIVFVLNNGGYLTERMFHDGPYNDIADWNYHKFPEMIGFGAGVKATTEDELEDAVNAALISDRLFVINAVVGKCDPTLAVKRVMGNLAKRGGFKAV